MDTGGVEQDGGSVGFVNQGDVESSGAGSARDTIPKVVEAFLGSSTFGSGGQAPKCGEDRGSFLGSQLRWFAGRVGEKQTAFQLGVANNPVHRGFALRVQAGHLAKGVKCVGKQVVSNLALEPVCVTFGAEVACGRPVSPPPTPDK